MIYLFWGIIVLLVFAVLLAVQMRMICAQVMKKAVQHHLGEAIDAQAAYAAVLEAAAGNSESAGASYLVEKHAQPLGHLRLARKSVAYLIPALLGALLIGKFVLKAF